MQNGLLLKGLADHVAIGGHFADRAIDVPLPQTIQAPDMAVFDRQLSVETGFRL
jgi:hypothetical protein